MFKRKSWLKAPLAPDVAERYLSPVGQDVTPVKSFCAKGDGATGAVDYGVQNVCGSGASLLSYEVIVSSLPTVTGMLISEYLTAGNARGWAIELTSALAVQFYLGKSDGTFQGVATVAGTGINAGDKLGVIVEAHGSDLLFTVYVNNVSVGSDTLVGQNKIYSNGAKLINFAYNNGTSNFSDCAICNETLTVDGVVKLNTPFNGSTYDISGNDYHGTVNGTVDLFETQDVFHYNLRNGVSKWRDTGASTPYANSDYTWVPWVDGAPVVDTVAGHELKYSCAPVEFKGDSPIRHNGCETGLRLPTGSLMDKSDTDNWLAGLRALDSYDAGNPTDWFFNLGVAEMEDLTPTTIQTYWDDLKNKVFIGSKPNEYVYIDGCPQFDAVDGEPEYSNTDPSLTANELLVYTNAKAEQFCLLIMMWYKKILRGY